MAGLLPALLLLPPGLSSLLPSCSGLGETGCLARPGCVWSDCRGCQDFFSDCGVSPVVVMPS